MISPRSESSANKPNVQKKEYKYIISAHGGIITSNKGTKYMAIKIPTNVEIFTYSKLGEILASSCKKNYFICDNLDKVKSHGFMLETPIHKYSYKSDSQNIFPEVALTADSKIVLSFYSGIVHCIPEHLRTTNTKAMEVIYNIDALVKQDCDKTTIGRAHPLFGPKIEDYTKLNEYNTEKQYSTYYKNQLKNYKYDPKSKDTKDNVSNKCGPLLLSQAIKVIQAHCKATYSDCNTSTIQIYLSCCLVTSDIDNYYEWSNYFSKTSKEEFKKVLAEWDINNKQPERDDKQMEKYYKIKEGYFSLDMKSIIDDSLYTTRLKDFDSSKNLEEDRDDGFSYSYIYLAKQIILIVSKLDVVKYNNVTFHHYRKMLYSALDSVRNRLFELYLGINELPNKIIIDLRLKTPNETIIYDELLKVARDSKLNSKLKYFITLGANKYTIEVHLEHDTYEYLKNGNYSSTESIISEQVDRVSNHKINKQSIFTIANKYTIKLKVSDLNLGNNELYDKMIAQVEAAAEAAAKASIEAAEEIAAAQHRELIQSVRKEAAQAAAREAEEAAAREAEEAAARKAEEAAARKAARKAAREAEAAREATAREAAAREAAKAAREAAKAEREAEAAREAARLAAEREAVERETAREAEEATAREAEAAREANNNTRGRQFFSRSRGKVAPEERAVVSPRITRIALEKDLNKNQSQNSSRTIIQRLGTLFSRKSRKVAPEPSKQDKAGGFKTKFKRKRRRKQTRRPKKKTLKRYTRRHRKI